MDTQTLYRYPFEQLRQRLQESALTDIFGLSGVFARHVVARVLGENSSRNGFVIVSDETELEQWRTDLEFFLGTTHTIVEIPSFDSAVVAHVGSQRHTVMRLHSALSTLIWSEKPVIAVASADAIRRRVIPRLAFDARTQLLSQEEMIDRDAFAEQLVEAGYLSVPTVEDEGTFALRGSICDVYPVGAKSPARIELWGDEVESILLFDPNTQRGIGVSVETLVIPPAREETFSSEAQHRTKREILAAAGRSGIPTRKLQPLLDDLMQGIPFVGMEAVRALFYEHLDSVFHYLPKDTLVCWTDPSGCTERWMTHHTRTVAQRERSVEEGELVVEEHRDYLANDQLIDRMAAFTQVRCHLLEFQEDMSGAPIRFQTPQISVLKSALQDARNQREPLRPLIEFVRDVTGQGRKVMIACRQRLQRERLERVF
ncbi:MAG: hypothetical protein ACPGQS_14565, partial [Bradymonadia bacterium]